MRIFFRIAFRNLIRQKKRNGLLGFAIAFGMVVLIISNSFAAGLTDIFMHKIMAFLTGHIEIAITEKANVNSDIIRDFPEWEEKIKNHVEGIEEIKNVVDVWARIVANGNGQNASLIGLRKKDIVFLNLSATEKKSFFQNPNACIIYKDKAEKLEVEIGDLINARFNRINGQLEGGKYEVVAILSGGNPFISSAVYVDEKTLRKQLGYREHEAKKLQIILEKPLTANKQADNLHENVTEEIAALSISLNFRGEVNSFTTLGIAVREVKKKLSKRQNLKFYFSSLPPPKTLYLSKSLIKKIKIQNDNQIPPKVDITLHGKYEVKTVSFKIDPTVEMDIGEGDIVLFSEKDMLKYYYRYFPQTLTKEEQKHLDKIKKWSGEENLFLKRYVKLRRSKDMNDIMAKFAEFNKTKWRGQALDIRTMYETGTTILSMEKAINAVTNIAIFFMFIIIIIGVSNTVKMSMRERTREMGTNRAIGMQRKDMQVVFLLEIGMLLIFSTTFGIAVARLLMFLFSLIFISNEGMASFFLLDGHIHFVFNAVYLTAFIFLIWISILFFVYFPIRKASKIKPADAIRFV